MPRIYAQVRIPVNLDFDSDCPEDVGVLIYEQGKWINITNHVGEEEYWQVQQRVIEYIEDEIANKGEFE